MHLRRPNAFTTLSKAAGIFRVEQITFAWWIAGRQAPASKRTKLAKKSAGRMAARKPVNSGSKNFVSFFEF